MTTDRSHPSDAIRASLKNADLDDAIVDRVVEALTPQPKPGDAGRSEAARRFGAAR